MAETIQQYIARMTDLVGDRDPAAVLAATPDRLRTLVNGATPDVVRWTTSPTRWSIAEIAAHLADAEIVGAWRIRSVLARDNIGLQAYDQNEWAAAFRYDQTDAAESVALFEVLRRSNLRVLRVVDPVRLAHAGLHEERGRESVTHIMRMYAGHDLNHLGQIERLLADARQAQV
jgi:uncharacterized damage-inducible protein DinB